MPPTRSIRPRKTAGAINTDVMGVLGPARDFSVRGNQKFGLLDMLVEEGAKRGRRFTPDPRAGTGTFYRSDHFTFAKAGIPALDASRRADDLVNGRRRRRRRHGKPITGPTCTTSRPTNSIRAGTSPAWSQDAELLHAVGLRLANSCDWPNWSADSEFRAARDRAAAERQGTCAGQAQRRASAASADKYLVPALFRLC